MTVSKKKIPASHVVNRTSTPVAGPIYCSTMPEANAVPNPSLRGRCSSTTATSSSDTMMCTASKRLIRMFISIRDDDPRTSRAACKDKEGRRMKTADLPSEPAWRTLQRTVTCESLNSTRWLDTATVRWFSKYAMALRAD